MQQLLLADRPASVTERKFAEGLVSEAGEVGEVGTPVGRLTGRRTGARTHACMDALA